MTDRAFFKSFAGLIGALVALTVVIFIIAQMVGGKPSKVETTADAKAVAERIKPVGEVTVGTAEPVRAVEVSSNPVMEAIIPSAQAAPADKGKTVYEGTCVACHGGGIAGAPKFGDKAAWAPRIALGIKTLHQQAIKGFQGKTGMMPPKGGNMSLSDADVMAAVDYMVGHSK
ncbi:MAG: c-type cytochrome [Sulfuricaulis sp.]